MVIRLPLRGILEVNCYLYADEKTRRGFLIDPGARGEELLSWIRESYAFSEIK